MKSGLLSAVNLHTALYEAQQHFYSNFVHDYCNWLRERHCLTRWSTTQPHRLFLIFDEQHDLPSVDSPMRKPVEWLISHFHLCEDGQPFFIK